MSTGLQVYSSNDANSPVLTGSSASLVTVLDACLVNGYGSRSAAGVAGSGAGAWTITYTATGKRVYRPSAGNRLYLRIRDDAGGTGGAKEAVVRGFETMSDIDTGTNGMPTSGQSSLTDNGLIVRKSALADAITVRPWIVAADDRTVMMFIMSGDTVGNYTGWYWGDFYSALSADGYRTLLVARRTENDAGLLIGNAASPGDAIQNVESNMANIGGHFVQRNRLSASGPLQVGKSFLPGYTVGATDMPLGNQTAANPNGPDGGIYLLPIFVTETSGTHVRGRMRGFWTSMQNRTGFNDGDTFAGAGDLNGRTFRVIKYVGDGTGYFIIETSDTWDTSS